MHAYLKHIILSVIVLTSCQGSRLSPEDYTRWIRDNKDILTASKEIEGIEFSVQYQPVELLVLDEFKKLHDIDPEKYSRRVKERGGMEHYMINISPEESGQPVLKHELKSEEDYFGRVQYYSFRMNNDIRLVQGDDTVDCMIHHFERSYGLTPGITITAGFPAAKDTEHTSRTLIIQDRVFNRGKINIKLKHLHKIPSVRI